MISKDMLIADIIRQHPESISIFKKFGLACNECQIANYADLGHGAQVHSIDIEALLTELNRVISC
jgi:hybrid cluster-associated redox disulfide protein